MTRAMSIKQGETVRIEETAPISKLKTWKVIERVDTHATPEAGDHRRLSAESLDWNRSGIPAGQCEKEPDR